MPLLIRANPFKQIVSIRNDFRIDNEYTLQSKVFEL